MNFMRTFESSQTFNLVSWIKNRHSFQGHSRYRSNEPRTVRDFQSSLFRLGFPAESVSFTTGKRPQQSTKRPQSAGQIAFSMDVRNKRIHASSIRNMCLFAEPARVLTTPGNYCKFASAASVHQFMASIQALYLSYFGVWMWFGLYFIDWVYKRLNFY